MFILKQKLKTLLDKLRSLKTKSKILLISTIIVIFIILLSVTVYTSNSNYQILFSNLDSSSANEILEQLDKKKISSKVEGDTIYVPKKNVDKLRLELSSSISTGSGGFELMDEGISIGMTTEEFNLKKQRILQGELEKTIKSFNEIIDARVHIYNGEKSVFDTENVDGKASVYLKTTPGKNLNQNQIVSIISLISSSSFNIPKQNVEVMDSKMNLLSDGLYDDNGKFIGTDLYSSQDIYDTKEKFNTSLEKVLIQILEPIYGTNNVRVKVSSDINLDSIEKNEIVVNPDKVLISEQTSTSENNTLDNTSNSPVDNNMNNEGNDNNTIIGDISSQETKNYEVGKSEMRTIYAPGKINRLTASVVVSENLTDEQKQDIVDIVTNSIGLDTNRGDSMTVVGTKFNKDFENNKDVFDENGDNLLSGQMLKVVYIVAIILSILLIIAIVFFMRRRKNKKVAQQEELIVGEHIDEIINNNILDDKNVEEKGIEDEVKTYAMNKSKEVAEIIKTWLK